MPRFYTESKDHNTGPYTYSANTLPTELSLLLQFSLNLSQNQLLALDTEALKELMFLTDVPVWLCPFGIAA